MNPKAFDAWFQLADRVALRYGIPFMKIDELAEFMQKTAYQIVLERGQAGRESHRE